MTIIGCLLLGIFVAEVIGYVVHRLLHSGALGMLSRMHMRHHLIDFPPGSRMRIDRYVSAAADRTNIIGIGMEWIAPIAILAFAVIGVMTAIGLSLLSQLVVIGSAIGWSLTMFNYMHDAMHIERFWMLRIPGIGSWFKGVRRLHDIHHITVDERNRSQTNFGICVFVFDRVFGTFSDPRNQRSS